MLNQQKPVYSAHIAQESVPNESRPLFARIDNDDQSQNRPALFTRVRMLNLESCHAVIEPHKPVEFNDAITFVNKVKVNTLEL